VLFAKVIHNLGWRTHGSYPQAYQHPKALIFKEIVELSTEKCILLLLLLSINKRNKKITTFSPKTGISFFVRIAKPKGLARGATTLKSPSWLYPPRGQQ
jgi:hypothetical protein